LPATRLSRRLSAGLVLTLASAAATAADCTDRQVFLNQVGFTPDSDKFAACLGTRR
jgi:hypothetical protein